MRDAAQDPSTTDMSAADEVEMRRLRWRCRRGMRELDQLLVRWLEREWRQSDTDERAVFLRLLDSEDDRLWKWFVAQDIAPDAPLQSLVDRIRSLPP